MKKIIKCFQLILVIFGFLVVTKVSVDKDNVIVYNDSSNKVLDLTAMAIKIEEIRMNDLYYPKDTYVGYLTAYVADCPLCGGTLGCTGQNVLDRTTTYSDIQYGTVRILASSLSMPCGSIIKYNFNNQDITGIVLDRGVTGTSLDLLVASEDEAYTIGRRYISYDVLRYGWSRSNS